MSDDLTPSGDAAVRLARKAVEAKRQIGELEAAIDRVRRLHDQYSAIGLAPGEWCPGCGHPEPCPTIRALNGQERTA